MAMARPEAEGESWTLPAANNGRRGVSGELLPAFGEPFPPSVGNIINPYDCRYRYASRVINIIRPACARGRLDPRKTS